MIAVLWQFTVKPGREREFEKLFGADGAWQALARRSRSFLGSSFLRDQAQPNRYLLAEYWSEMVVYEKHVENFSGQIRRLDEQRNLLLDETAPLGVFTALDVPDRAGPTWSRRDGA